VLISVYLVRAVDRGLKDKRLRINVVSRSAPAPYSPDRLGLYMQGLDGEGDQSSGKQAGDHVVSCIVFRH
jgi:hypothetical protein